MRGGDWWDERELPKKIDEVERRRRCFVHATRTVGLVRLLFLDRIVVASCPVLLCIFPRIFRRMLIMLCSIFLEQFGNVCS